MKRADWQNFRNVMGPVEASARFLSNPNHWKRTITEQTDDLDYVQWGKYATFIIV